MKLTEKYEFRLRTRKNYFTDEPELVLEERGRYLVDLRVVSFWLTSFCLVRHAYDPVEELGRAQKTLACRVEAETARRALVEQATEPTPLVWIKTPWQP